MNNNQNPAQDLAPHDLSKSLLIPVDVAGKQDQDNQSENPLQRR